MINIRIWKLQIPTTKSQNNIQNSKSKTIFILKTKILFQIFKVKYEIPIIGAFILSIVCFL